MLGGNISAGQPGPSPLSVNTENAEFCNSSIPEFVYRQEKETNGTEHYSRKTRKSGKFTTGKKEVLINEMWPHHLIDSILQPEGVEYDDLNAWELNNGFTAKILALCDANTNKEVVTMLMHLNRLNAYGMFAPRSTVLEFNAGFMMGVENKTQSWSNRAKMVDYHDKHLHSLKIASYNKGDNKGDKKNSDDGQEKPDKSDKPKKQPCTKDWVQKQGICFNYQNDQCGEESGHDDGNGNATVHCCAWCYYNQRGFKKHNNTTCVDKKNPFRHSRSRNGQ